MRCEVCRQGETRPGTPTVVLQRGSTTVVINDVPALVCENCGEDYVDEHVAETVLSAAEASARAAVRVKIRDYVRARLRSRMRARRTRDSRPAPSVLAAGIVEEPALEQFRELATAFRPKSTLKWQHRGPSEIRRKI